MNKHKPFSKIPLYLGALFLGAGLTSIILQKTYSKTRSSEVFPNLNIQMNLFLSSLDTHDNTLETKVLALGENIINQSTINLKYVFISDPKNATQNAISINGRSLTSPSGRKEVNQNIREMCAFDQRNNNYQWLQFTTTINTVCTVANIDLCWQEVARSTGYNPQLITNCFTNETPTLLEKYAITNPSISTFSSNTQTGNELLIHSNLL